MVPAESHPPPPGRLREGAAESRQTGQNCVCAPQEVNLLFGPGADPIEVEQKLQPMDELKEAGTGVSRDQAPAPCRSLLDLISRAPLIPAILPAPPAEQLEEGGETGPWVVQGWRLHGPKGDRR